MLRPLTSNVSLPLAPARPSAPPPLSGDAMLSEDLSPACRQRLQSLLAELPPELVSKLEERGVTLETAERLKDPTHHGHFNPRNLKVHLLESALMGEEGKAVLCHELGHALDFLLGQNQSSKWRKILGKVLKPESHSSQTQGLTQPHQQFLAKEAARQAVDIRNQMKAPEGVHGFQLGPYQGTLMSGPDQSAMVGVQKPVKWPVGALVQTGLGIALGVAGVIATGGAGLALLTVGAGLAAQGGKVTYDDMSAQHSDRAVLSQVADANGQPVQISQRGRMTAVNLPAGSVAPAMDWTTHSTYVAHNQYSREEYFAEGVSAYLESPERREKLRSQEPELFHDVEASLTQFQFADNNQPKNPQTAL